MKLRSPRRALPSRLAAVVAVGFLVAACRPAPADHTSGDVARDTTDATNTPALRDVADTSDMLDVADVVDVPETPDISDTPNTPDAPNAPDTPDTLDTPDTSAIIWPDAGPAPTSFIPPTTVTTVDLGTFTHKINQIILGPFTVTIPANAVSFVINLDGTTAISYGVNALETPTGVTVVNAGWIHNGFNLGGQLCLTCKLRVTTRVSANAVLLPNAPTPKIELGTYKFNVLARKRSRISPFKPIITTYPAGKVRISVAIKTAVPSASATGGLPTTGIIDLNLYFTGSNGYWASSAPKNKVFIAWLSNLRTSLLQVGISVGTLRFVDIDPGYQVIDGMADSAINDFEEVAALTAKAPWGLNVIFVRTIALPPGSPGALLGLSGGIPGPVAVQGTGRSAIIVSTETLLSGGIKLDTGTILAHEIGHYLGLFHTSESAPSQFQLGIHDPLPDTAKDDASNLMYFNPGLSNSSKLSTQQGRVLRGNPWVRHGGQP